MKTSQDRLKYLIETYSKGNVSEFSRLIGKSNTTLTNSLKGKNEPSLQVIQAICEKFPNVSRNWLLLGIGEPFEKNITNNSNNTTGGVEIELRSENNFLRRQVEQMTAIIQSLTMSMGKFKASIFPAVYKMCSVVFLTLFNTRIFV